MSTPSSNASVPENNPPSEELRQLRLGEYDDAQFGGLEIRSVEPVGNSPDTPAVQLDNDNAHQENGIMVASSRRRQVDDADIDDTDNEGRNVRPRVAEEYEVLENDSVWTIMTNYTEKHRNRDHPLSRGMVMIVNGRRIPCQKIGGNPHGNDPLGEHRGWYFLPIYLRYNGKSGANGLNAIKQVLRANHFDIDNSGAGEDGRKPVGWWNTINNSNNFEWHETTGFSILGIEGIVELFGGIPPSVSQLKRRKRDLADYDLRPVNGQWPGGTDVTRWDTYPIHIVHPQGYFHGNGGGEEDAKKIVKMDVKQIASRKRTKVVMNHFFLLNRPFHPSNNSRVVVEAEGWLKLRDGSEGEDIEEMLDQIESGIIS